MKNRQYKKLCKKSAEIMGFKNCYNDGGDGIYYSLFDCGGCDSDRDSKDCWTWLVDLFHGDVNTVADKDSECGISWCSENQFTKATPRNVFTWAKKQSWL